VGTGWGRATGLWPAMAALVLYAAVLAVLARGLWLRLNTSIIGPIDSDNFWYAWSIWQFRRALLNGRDPSYSHDIFALSPPVPIFADGFFNQLLSVPLQTLLTPVGAYNVTVLLSFPLAGLTMYLLASVFTKNWLACLLAGLLFTFSTYHLARASWHLGLATIQWLPFCAWGLILFWRAPGVRNALLAGLGMGLVAWSDVYYLPYFLLPFGAVLAGTMLIADRHWFARRRNLALGVLVIGVAALVTLPSVLSYLFLDSEVRSAINLAVAPWQKKVYNADLIGFVVPDPYNPLLGRWAAPLLADSPNTGERSVFLGYPMLALAAAALLLHRTVRRRALPWLVLSILGLLLALGSELRFANRVIGDLPFYDLVYGRPPLSNFRTPDRLVILALVGLGVLSALGSSALLGRLRLKRRQRAVAGGILLAVTLIGLLPNTLFAYGIKALPVAVPSLYGQLAAIPDDGLLLDVPTRPVFSPMYFQTVHGKRMVGGSVPRELDRTLTALENVPYLSLLNSGHALPARDGAGPADIYPVPGFRDGLRANDISFVVLHRWTCPDPTLWYQCAEIAAYQSVRRFLLNSLGTPIYDRESEGLTAWHSSGSGAVYQPPLTFQLGQGWIPGLSFGAGDRPQRSMGKDAVITVQAAAPMEVRLRMTMSAMFRDGRLQLALNGRPAGSADLLASRPLDIDMEPFRMNPGLNKLELHMRSGCTALDGRCYGARVSDLEILPASSPGGGSAT
jgi:hypothetical protein